MFLSIILLPALIMQPSVDPYAYLDIDYDSLAAAAHEAYMLEDYDAAVTGYLTYLERNVNDSSALYNLACCYGLLDNEELATDFVLRSIRAGFEDINWILWDPDFESIRDGERFSETLDSLFHAEQELENSLGSIFYIPGRTMIPVRIMLPVNFDPDTPNKLLIGLHGYGASPKGFIRLWEGFQDPEFIYAVPQAPYPRFAGADPGFSWMIWSDDEELAAATIDGSHQYIRDVAESLRENYNISEVYLLGFSQGAGFTFQTGFLNPELFDGLICFAGWLDTTIVLTDHIKAAEDLRVFIAHGTDDAVVEFEVGTTAFEYLSSFGMDVEFHDFPSGHTVDRETLIEAQNWIYSNGDI